VNRRLFIALLAALPAIRAYADRSAYDGVHEVSAARDGLTFRHRHDWSSPKISSLFLDLSNHQRFLSADNDFSFVELVQGDQVLFRAPAPALTYLWISPDARFFVGLSDIKLDNPYQLMVWRRDGSVVHHEHISAEVAKLSAGQKREFTRRFPDDAKFLASRYFTVGGATYLDCYILGVPDEISVTAWNFLFALRIRHPYSADFKESVTNEVEWFDAAHPVVGIEQNGTGLTLTLRSPSGSPMVIPL
jgi:hypothetical protein